MSNPILEHFQETSRAIDFNPEPEIMHVSISENQPVYDLWRKLQGVINKIRQNVEDIHVAISNQVSPLIAYQFVQITAAMLEASDDPLGVSVPRSVLITASQSAYEFNWQMSGGVRGYRVVLGPGSGVPSHEVIIDREDRNLAMMRVQAVQESIQFIPTTVARPYGLTALKLQFGEWRPKDGRFEFWPSSVSVGTWVYLEQTLPQVEIV